MNSKKINDEIRNEKKNCNVKEKYSDDAERRKIHLPFSLFIYYFFHPWLLRCCSHLSMQQLSMT